MLRETVAYFPSLYSIYATFSIGFFDGLQHWQLEARDSEVLNELEDIPKAVY